MNVPIHLSNFFTADVRHFFENIWVNFNSQVADAKKTIDSALFPGRLISEAFDELTRKAVYACALSDAVPAEHLADVVGYFIAKKMAWLVKERYDALFARWDELNSKKDAQPLMTMSIEEYFQMLILDSILNNS